MTLYLKLVLALLALISAVTIKHVIKDYQEEKAQEQTLRDLEEQKMKDYWAKRSAPVEEAPRVILSMTEFLTAVKGKSEHGLVSSFPRYDSWQNYGKTTYYHYTKQLQEGIVAQVVVRNGYVQTVNFSSR